MFFHCSMCPDTDQQDNTQFKLPVFEATGEIPKEEALKIHNPNKHARSPLATTQKPARKPKKPKHSHPTKVTNLLDKDSSPSPEPDQEPPIVSAQSHPTPHALVVPLSTPNTLLVYNSIRRNCEPTTQAQLRRSLLIRPSSSSATEKRIRAQSNSQFQPSRLVSLSPIFLNQPSITFLTCQFIRTQHVNRQRTFRRSTRLKKWR